MDGPENIEQPIEQPLPQQQEPLINVIDPDTQQVGSLPASEAQQALAQGYTQASPEQVDAYLKEQKYGTVPQQLLAGVEGATEAASMGVIPGFGSKEAIRGRREINPIPHMVGQGVGLVGSSALLPGGGAAGLLGKIGEGAAELVPQELGLVSKIGSQAVKSAAENAAFQGTDEVSKMVTSDDPGEMVGTAITNIGLDVILGGGLGAGYGTINPLWKATMGPKVEMFLKAVSDKAGGIEGVLPDEIQNAIHESGLQIAPEIRAGLAKDPQIQDLFKTLQESQTASGIEAQTSLKKFKSGVSDALVRSLGRTPEEVSTLGELSAYDSGKTIQESLHKAIKTEVEPISELFNNVQNKFKDVEVSASQQGELSEQIAKMIQEKGYYLSPSAPQSQLIDKTLGELTNIKTLDDVRKYTSIINEKTSAPEMWKVGGDLRKIFRTAESDILGQSIAKEAPDLVMQHSLARDSYQDIMGVIDTLNDRLHVGRYGGPDSFLKALKEMSPEDVLRRLSGKGDADLLQLLQERFPSVAGPVKDYHVNSLLKSAVAKAGEGEAINSKVLFSGIDKMDPKLVEFAFPEASRFSLDNKFNSLRSLIEGLPSKMNNSGTAKTLDALWSKVPSSAMGMAAMISGHNPFMGMLLGQAGKWLARDVPDAVKLGMLKFLGSSQQIESEGFKSMVDFIHHTIKGENLISKSVANIFKAGQEVLPQAFIPDEKSRTKLDKKLAELRQNPASLLDMGGKTGHYLPNHQQAVAQYAMNAVNVLNAERPGSAKMSPLDTEVEPTQIQKNQYDRTLDIAEQPLIVLKDIKEGTLTPKDVSDLQALNPELHQKLVQKLTNELTDQKDIPYKTRMGLSLFMGQPLDSTMTPQGIISAQGTFQMPPTPNQQQNQHKPALNSFKKLAGMDETVLGHRESSRR